MAFTTFYYNHVEALPNTKDAKNMEKHMFRLYDSNDDGSIDFVKFMVRRLYSLFNESRKLQNIPFLSDSISYYD